MDPAFQPNDEFNQIIHHARKTLPELNEFSFFYSNMNMIFIFILTMICFFYKIRKFHKSVGRDRRLIKAALENAVLN
jgi:hypothetical protein